jgi:hypothetical protein
MIVRTVLERRILTALDASPSRITVILGGCGSGRTHLLHQLRDRIGRTASQCVDVERSATTPERFLSALTAASPFRHAAADVGHDSARSAFDATLRFLTGVRGPSGEPATFLLDEALELRTFENFPGLRHVMRDLVDGLNGSTNRFVLTTRYVARAHRLLRDATSRFEVVHMMPLSGVEVRDVLPEFIGVPHEDGELEFLARAVHALADGRPRYVRAIAETMATLDEGHGSRPAAAAHRAERRIGDPVSALTALLSPDGRLSELCAFCYELRLHRARGYGALKAILEILAVEEPLTLTEISQRLHRTPGSTKDYLSWLEDVDLITSHQKRYSFTDPLLRLWVRLHCQTTPPAPEDVAREVQAYAAARLPHHEPAPAPALAMAGTAAGDDRGKPWGIIEID